MHCNFLTIDGGKMSKSLGNIYTLDTLKEKDIDPLAYKLLCFSSHYRNKLNFTFEGAMSANTSLQRLREGYKKHLEGTEDVEEEMINDFEEKFHSAINDDLNMPIAMSVVWDVVRYPKKSKALANLLLKFDSIMGLNIDKEEEKQEIPEEIQKLLEERKIARENKDWELSDKIRDIIKEKGYIIKDSQKGMIVEKLKK